MVSYPPCCVLLPWGPTIYGALCWGWQRSPEKYQNQLGARCLDAKLALSFPGCVTWGKLLNLSVQLTLSIYHVPSPGLSALHTWSRSSYPTALRSSSCCCSVTQSCLTLCNSMDCSTPGFPVRNTSWNLLKFMSIESKMPDGWDGMK